MGEIEISLSSTREDYGTSRPEKPPVERHPARTLLIALFSVIIFFVLVAAAALASYHVVYGQRIPLGVQVLDMDVGGLEVDMARSLLSDNLEAYLRTPVTLRYEGREWKVLPGELGASYDVSESIERALNLGQNGGILDRVQRQVDYIQEPRRLDIAFVFNDAAFQGGLARLARDIEKPPRDAEIKLTGPNVSLTPSEPGYQIDRSSLQASLAGYFSVLSASPIDLAVKTLPPQVKEEDLAQARKQIEAVLASPVTVKYSDKKWTLDRTALAGLVSFPQSRDASGKIQVQTAVASDKAEAWAKGVAKEVNREVQDARLAWNGGNVRVSSPGHPGATVETALFGDVLKKALAADNRTIDLPVTVVQPVGVGDISKLGIKEKLAGAGTSFAGSIPARAHNVRLGTQRLTGKVVPPGGIFSMNDTLGDVSEHTGYQLGFAIVGADTVPEFGGGICQVVTTAFKAAFAAGFPVVERTNHLYVIDHYVPVLGVEATIYQPGVDMKFKNDTDHHILVEAWTDGSDIHTAIYGTRPNREVVIEEPIISNVVPTDRTLIRQESRALPRGTQIMTEAAEDGMDVTVYRSIRVDGKEVRRDRLSSRYRPAHNVLLVGTGQ